MHTCIFFISFLLLLLKFFCFCWNCEKKLKSTHYRNQVIHLLMKKQWWNFRRKNLPLIKSVELFGLQKKAHKTDRIQWFSAFSLCFKWKATSKEKNCFYSPPPQTVVSYLFISLIIMIESQSVFFIYLSILISICFFLSSSLCRALTLCAPKVKITKKKDRDDEDRTKRWRKETKSTDQHCPLLVTETRFERYRTGVWWSWIRNLSKNCIFLSHTLTLERANAHRLI